MMNIDKHPNNPSAKLLEEGGQDGRTLLYYRCPFTKESGMAQGRPPGVFEKAGIGPGSIVSLEGEAGVFVFLAPSNLAGVRARVTAMIRPLHGDIVRVQQPSALSTDDSCKGLRLKPVGDAPSDYRHPKGFFETPKGSTIIPYPEWTKMVTASLIQQHPGDAPVIQHEQYGALWKFDVIRAYASHSYPGHCIRCGGPRVGSLVNTDHAHCDRCIPDRGLVKRFCRCCATPFQARGNIIFGPCHQWVRALRRGF
jgi:hypothetical protein